MMASSGTLSTKRLISIRQTREAIRKLDHPDVCSSEIRSASELSRSTVAHTLDWLVDAGELRHTRTIGTAKMYEPTEEFDSE